MLPSVVVAKAGALVLVAAVVRSIIVSISIRVPVAGLTCGNGNRLPATASDLFENSFDEKADVDVRQVSPEFTISMSGLRLILPTSVQSISENKSVTIALNWSREFCDKRDVLIHLKCVRAHNEANVRNIDQGCRCRCRRALSCRPHQDRVSVITASRVGVKDLRLSRDLTRTVTKEQCHLITRVFDDARRRKRKRDLIAKRHSIWICNGFDFGSAGLRRAGA